MNRVRVPFLILAAHGLMLAWIGLHISPVCDEVGHLPAGLYVWHFGRFDVYRVNPPLVRTVAALPVAAGRPKCDWSDYRKGSDQRPEWNLGRKLVAANEDQAFWYFTIARWMCIPFSLLGGWVCWQWAQDLYGRAAGVTACTLWCFCPNVLAWGSTICPDSPAAALGAAASYAFWIWLQRPTWRRAVAAGIVLGLAELTKTTWIVLFAVWPLLWLEWWWGRRGDNGRPRGIAQIGQLGAILILGVYMINLGYTFEDTFRRLEDYTFVSRTLAGKDSVVEGGQGGNRFAGTWLGRVPIPVPMNYLGGIDLQKRDFEEGKPSYLRGEWKHGGWWYYYLYAATLKVPLGTWCLGLVALGLTLSGRRRETDVAEQRGSAAQGRGYSAGWLNEFTLLLPAVAVFLLVSSQTGFSRYFRYVLPCFPFVFIWVSKVARSATFKDRAPLWLGAAALGWSVASSLYYYPHSMSYFNELAGGPTRGHRYLIDANIDWGQDMHYLRRWLDEHPEARPLRMAYLSYVHPRHFGIEYESPPEGPVAGVSYSGGDAHLPQLGPQPGWYAMSVHRIYSDTQNYRYFLEFEPVAMAGYSIYIYHITLEDANRVRRKLGVPDLKAGQAVGKGLDHVETVP